MGGSPSKQQNTKGKVVLEVKRENTRIKYQDGVKASKEKNVDTITLTSDDSSHFKEISSKLNMNMNQKAVKYK